MRAVVVLPEPDGPDNEIIGRCVWCSRMYAATLAGQVVGLVCKPGSLFVRPAAVFFNHRQQTAPGIQQTLEDGIFAFDSGVRG